MSASAITRRAPAKINLALAVGPPEPPRGYHPIASLFACIDLFDDLHIQPLAAGEASRYEVAWAIDAPRPTPIDWPIERDLAVRAHRALERHVARELPIRFSLSKRIPVGAGLGGGSSDAAAVLLALNEVFALALPATTLAEIASGLGSDIPFFIDDARSAIPRPAVVGGFGEQLERLRLAPSVLSTPRLLLLLPDFGCATGAVYQAFDKLCTRRVVDSGSVNALAGGWVATGRLDAGRFFNDLASAAELVQPGLGQIRRRAAELVQSPVHITGSGSAMFLYFDEGDRSKTEQAAKTLRANLPGLGVLGARLA